jgi:4-hydroxy-tetrahydrodipicolinate synthase
MTAINLTGVMTALVTPFKNDKVDTDALTALVHGQIEAGINALVPCGSTGEAATMSADERLLTIETVVKAAGGRVPVVSGTSNNNTAESVEFTKKACDAGTDAVMLVAPAYNKPTQAGMILHFEAIANAVNVPVVLYNIPGRAAVSIDPETVVRLSQVDNIVAVKEASGKISNTVEILRGNPDFTVLSGDDLLFLPLLSVGAKGLVSVVSNVMPAAMVQMYNAWVAGKLDEAMRMFYEMWPVFGSMFYETNPIPAKAALGMMGKIDPTPRMPLTPITEASKKRLAEVLRKAGVIS